MNAKHGFVKDGAEISSRRLEPIIAKMSDDERTGVDLMSAYFHVYLNVRFIGQSNELIAVFQDLLEAGCEYRDVHAGMVEAHKALKRSPRWINVLKDMRPDHVLVHNREDDPPTVWAIVRPPMGYHGPRTKPATVIAKEEPTPPEEEPSQTNGVVHDAPSD